VRGSTYSQEPPIPPTLTDIHHLLDQRYGCRNWWPGETCFEVVVGCILTQNTNWSNVEKAILNLKQAEALHPTRILELDEARLVEMIRPTGFFTQKPARLRRVSEWWIKRVGEIDLPLEELPMDNTGGVLHVGRVARSLGMAESREAGAAFRQELLGLNGVGPETADAILLYAFGFPYFVVDAYKRRILSRVGVIPVSASYHQIQDLFHAVFPPDTPLYNNFHAQFIQLGKEYCRKQPRCTGCPLFSGCQARQLSSMESQKK